MTREMEKNYNPHDFENRIYERWVETGQFSANVNRDKEPFTIVLPPPNITGQLHMGHALDQTLQDALIRFKRMQGYETLWLPGTDHASIATEVKVVEKIREDEGKSKEELGRDEFLKRAWDWKDVYGRRIVEQMKKLGSSCDWDKERFTMDEGCNKAVTKVFVDLYEKDMIYKGNRMINWCTQCRTTLSDAEVEHEDMPGNFWHIKYNIEGSDKYLEIATTRPETMLGDTAVAVHPDDDRYKKYIGKTAILPILNKSIPIVGDEYVDMEKGTGALKVTPAHDPNDFEIGKRHNLEEISIMNEDGTMNHLAGKYEGMDRYECRKVLVKDLDDMGHLLKVKDHEHAVGTCYRCHSVIEPRISDQWFVKMDDLAAKALRAIDDGDTRFVPDRFTKIYRHWLENIRDWCISRQLWWGHRIPAWYCDDCGKVNVAISKPRACKCGWVHLTQDEDVLDTWFSSALWPFSTLGWPENTEELKYFYPTSVLVTGYDIIFFWVVRMMFSGLEHMDEVPFKDVFIHGMVRAEDGRKMSKSLGNGVDPLEVIESFGADALRFMLITGITAGNDMRFKPDKVESGRNFANKLWNASRFVLMSVDGDVPRRRGDEQLDLADKWILSELNDVVEEVTVNIEKYELNLAASKIYDFVWNTYCDWYIELAKKRLYSEDAEVKRTIQVILIEVLEDILKLLHPFMPFITEEIWRHINGDDAGQIIRSEFPVKKDELNAAKAVAQMERVMEAVKGIRNMRAEMDVIPSRKAKLIVSGQDDLVELLKSRQDDLQASASCSTVVSSSDEQIPKDAVSVVVQGGELFIPLEDLIDFEKEYERLIKEKAKLESEVQRVDKKLSNEGFVKKAPAHLIEEEKQKQIKYKEMLNTVLERLEDVKGRI